MANWPRRERQRRRRARRRRAWQNRTVGDVYEPGSTFKIVTVAGALQEGLVKPDTMFSLPPKIQVADRLIGEAHDRGAVLAHDRADPRAVLQRRHDHDRPAARRQALRRVGPALRVRDEVGHRAAGRGAGTRPPARQVLGLLDGQPADRPGRGGHRRPARRRLRDDRQRRHPAHAADDQVDRRQEGRAAQGQADHLAVHGLRGPQDARGRHPRRRDGHRGRDRRLHARGQDGHGEQDRPEDGQVLGLRVRRLVRGLRARATTPSCS